MKLLVRCVCEALDNPDYYKRPWGEIYYEDVEAEIREEEDKKKLVLFPGKIGERSYSADLLDSMQIVKIGVWSYENNFYGQNTLFTSDKTDAMFESCKKVLLQNQLSRIQTEMKELEEASKQIEQQLNPEGGK